MDEILDYHSRGEETVVFPAVDNVAPLVAMAYQMDNRELYKMGESLEARPLSVRFAKQISTSSFPICSQKTLKPHIGEHTLQEVIMI